MGTLVAKASFSVDLSQRDAWLAQIGILRDVLAGMEGKIYFEFAVPRMGSRIDTLLIIGHVIFVLEFKIGERHFTAQAVDQVTDYALDLKNFHKTSHHRHIIPILVATHAKGEPPVISSSHHNDRLLIPVRTNASRLRAVLDAGLELTSDGEIDPSEWEAGRYSPTPTIVEAARALYGDHTVADISRSDAGAVNLHRTSAEIDRIIREARDRFHKAVCFVTGVPGAGKTLVGLNVATNHIDAKDETYSVFLSGNGPLVTVLREALARDQVSREKARGNRISKTAAMTKVKAFIQNVHHFRDECLKDPGPPCEHVALFDEAQRAWNLEMTRSFMRRKRDIPDFDLAEPEFLIRCLDRHPDWAVVVCLVGGGQEINRGEAGISEWIESLERSFPDWHVHVSPRLTDSEYAAGRALEMLSSRPNVSMTEELHLSVSMRSFRSENVSLLIKQLLDLDRAGARETMAGLRDRYPVAITRDLGKAKRWLRTQARGSERYGIVVSSHAERLKPHAIDVKSPMDPVHWFLDGKDDVRSSFYLEDVATEFHVQGLELDWSCITWDADFRHAGEEWGHWSFRGSRWERIRQAERQIYQKNAYRVLLTRARQGMVIFVPPGDPEDGTRNPSYYNPTFEYLAEVGFPII